MRRLKKAVPEFEEVDDDGTGSEEEGWVAYSAPNPNMDLLRPLLRTAEAMLDPTKENSYHIKLSAARGLVKALGKDFTIEGEAIVKALPFQVKYSYRVNKTDEKFQEAVYLALRGHLERLPAAAMRGIDGVEIFTEGKAPSAMQKGWLYVSAPQATQTIGTTYALYGPDRVSLHGDREAKAGQPARFPRNGLANGDLDIAVLAPQTIYLKLYVAGTRMSEVIWTAIALGAQRAMALTGGNVTTKEWVPEAGTRYNEERAKRAKTAEAAVEQQKALIKASADAILNAQLALEMAQEEFDNYSKKLKASDLMKELPALEMVEWVNRDDPYKTVVKTKDLVLHGVNLGGYVITFVHNTMNVAVMGTKVAPEGIVHPNIWQEKGKWQQDIPKDRLNELIAAMGAGNIHLAANLIITNLMNCPNSGDHAKRLEALRVAIATKDEQVKAKAARKAKKAEAVPVETKEPIKEVVA